MQTVNWLQKAAVKVVEIEDEIKILLHNRYAQCYMRYTVGNW